jgi:hypothetical protein
MIVNRFESNATRQYFAKIRRKNMRKVIQKQMKFGEVAIRDIEFVLRSRYEIPKLLLGLQEVYCDLTARREVFEVLVNLLPKGITPPHRGRSVCPGSILSPVNKVIFSSISRGSNELKISLYSGFFSKFSVIKQSNSRLPNSFTKKVFPTCLAPRTSNGRRFLSFFHWHNISYKSLFMNETLKNKNLEPGLQVFGYLPTLKHVISGHFPM